VVHGSRANDVLPLYEIPAEEAFAPSAETRGVVAAIPRNDTISAKQAHAWLTSNVPEDPYLRVPPPPDAPGLHPMKAADPQNFYVNWRDLYDAKDFRWHQFLAARDWGKVEDVIKFGAANLRTNGRPVFLLQMADGEVYYVKIDVRKK